MKWTKRCSCFLVLVLLLLQVGCGGISTGTSKELPAAETESDRASVLQTESELAAATEEDLTQALDPKGSYTTKEDVSLYLYTYKKLPANFITKEEAKKLGWEGGSVEPYAPGMCIGGDYFGNYEELLPEKDGREYHECDIDTLGKDSRGEKRIVYSNDGLIYYTEDHYASFTQLYGEE